MKTTKYMSTQFVLSISALAMTLLIPASVLAVHFPEPGESAQGAKVWAENCSRCHNMRDPQDLRDDQWITTAFHMRIRAGLTGQQTRDVLTFLQESNAKVVIEPVVFSGTATTGKSKGSTQSGDAVYNGTCVACHSTKGKGNVPGAPDFTKPDGALSQSDEVLFKHIKEGFQRPNSPMAMPPKGGNAKLKDAEIRNVLEYLRETFTQ
jgi:cytochrome c5